MDRPVGRDWTWILGAATLALGVSVLIDRYDGRVVDFTAGFFLGLSLALAVGFLVLASARTRSVAG